MSRTVEFRRTARRELEDAVDHYDSSRPGLGDVFAVAVGAVLDEVSAKPNRYPATHRDIREAPVPGYPYCVCYRVRPRQIIVVAVYHQSRDPSGWQNRT